MKNKAMNKRIISAPRTIPSKELLGDILGIGARSTAEAKDVEHYLGNLKRFFTRLKAAPKNEKKHSPAEGKCPPFSIYKCHSGLSP